MVFEYGKGLVIVFGICVDLFNLWMRWGCFENEVFYIICIKLSFEVFY